MKLQHRIPLITAAVIIAAQILPASLWAEELNNPHPFVLQKDSPPKDLYTVFSEYDLLDGVATNSGQTKTIWTRAYGYQDESGKEKQAIPGPTFYIAPDYLFQVNLLNDLIEEKYPNVNDLEKYEELIPVTPVTSSKDEVAKNIVHHEVNVPHNPNNINLHVHGLHVAPSQDDVTIVLLPKDSKDAYKYAQPYKFLAPLTERDVSDRPVATGKYAYSYRIPTGHLPGTHWYHSHKHGSTAIQVENGMAGAIVMGQHTKNDPLAPANIGKNADVVERVMLIQGLNNYGINFGKGQGRHEKNGKKKASIVDASQAVVTLNGDTKAFLSSVPNGQIERWRVVNATANRASIAYLWVGRKDPSDATGKTYISTPVHAIAVDGITLPRQIPITADAPALLGPGNRVDLLVQFDAVGNQASEYHLFQNVPSGITIKQGPDSKVTAQVFADRVKWLKIGPQYNPLIFADADKGTKNYSNTGVVQFRSLYGSTPPNPPAKAPAAQPLATQDLIPILRTKQKGKGLLEMQLADGKPEQHTYTDKATGEKKTIKRYVPTPGATGWTLGSGTGLNPEGVSLLKVSVDSGTKATTRSIADIKVHPYSPGPQGGLAPAKQRAYVNPIHDKDILQSRTVVFDVSDVRLFVEDYKYGTKTVKGKQVPTATAWYKFVNQFTINGRVFALDDPVGGPNAVGRVPQSVGQHLWEFTNDIDPTINFFGSRGNCLDSYTLAGYYLPLLSGTAKVKGKDVPYFTYKRPAISNIVQTTIPYYDTAGPNIGKPAKDKNGNITPLRFNQYEKYPNLADITGLRNSDGEPVVAVLNEASYKGAVPANTGGLPIAQTAEEWVLVNNSSVAHPFHIHINPFFVTEIGQLTHDTDPNADTNKGWMLDKIKWNSKSKTVSNPQNSPLAWMVGVWWDTILIPPRGYVKMRYWFNVPTQKNGVVTDNDNAKGIWVYHCHILRHEDRGMMMVVETQENKGLDVAREEAKRLRDAARKRLNAAGGSGED